MSIRVRELAENMGLNATTLGSALEIPSSSAANYWSGKRSWPTEVLHLLADALHTTVDYLLGRTADSGVIKFRGSHEQFDEMVELMSDRHKKDDDDLVEVAEINLRYGLGGAFVDEDSIESEPRHFSRQWLRSITDSPPALLFWARTQGNSMSPTIEDGEIVLGDRSQTRPDYDDLVWACALGEIGMIKRLRFRADRVKILSDNPVVPDDIAHPDDDLRIVGRIVAVVKKL